jgi:hypothetical protein
LAVALLIQAMLMNMLKKYPPHQAVHHQAIHRQVTSHPAVHHRNNHIHHPVTDQVLKAVAINHHHQINSPPPLQPVVAIIKNHNSQLLPTT